MWFRNGILQVSTRDLEFLVWRGVCDSKRSESIVTQWGKYEYQRLPMGLCNSPDIFQEKMSELLIGLDTVRVYIDDLLHVTKVSWTEHLSILE